MSMSYITEAFGGGDWGRPIVFNPDASIPADRLPVARRAHAASAARAVLGDDADVYDIVTLAEFLLGEGDAQPAPATAEPTPVCMRPHFGASTPVTPAGGAPFSVNVTDKEGVRVGIYGYKNHVDDYAVTLGIGGSAIGGLTAAEARDLRDKLTGLLG